MQARDLLLSIDDVRSSMEPGVELRPSRNTVPPQAFGDLVGAVATDSAYASFAGRANGGAGEHPIAVGCLALVLPSAETATSTFSRVAEAAHIRTRVGEADVAVETVTSSTGLVSYWGFLVHGPALVIITADTLDLSSLSMTNFRALAMAAAQRLARTA